MLELSAESFNDFVGSNKLSIVECGSPSCVGCRLLKGIINKLADLDNVQVASMDASSDLDFSRKLFIEKLPVVLFFKDGVEKHRITGMTTKQQLLEIIKDIE